MGNPYTTLTANYSPNALRDNTRHYAFHDADADNNIHGDNRTLKDVIYNLCHLREHQHSLSLLNRETAADTVDILDILTRRQRQAVTFHIINDMTLEEAGNKMNCSAVNVHKLVRRALTAIADMLGDDSIC